MSQLKLPTTGIKSLRKHGLWATLQPILTLNISIRPKYYLKKKYRHDFVSLLVNLLENGFSYQESLNFIQKVWPFSHDFLYHLKSSIEKGNAFYVGFSDIGFPKQQVAQLYLAEKHGDIIDTLHHISNQMKDQDRQRKKLYEVMTYPFILLLFLMGMFGFMRVILLPQLQLSIENPEENIGVLVIKYAPLIGVLTLGLCVLVGGSIYVLLKKKSLVKK